MFQRLKHPETGKVVLFGSIEDLAEFYGVSKRSVERALEARPAGITRAKSGRNLLVCTGEYAAALDHDTPALERKRELEIQMLDLTLAERRGDLVRPAEIRAALVTFSALLRKAGDTLGRKYGPEAQLILIENLDDAMVPIQEAIETAGE